MPQQNLSDLIKLKGIGDYTASAIASFSFNEKKAVVDGNVYRVLSRFFGVKEDINSKEGKAIIKDIKEIIIDFCFPRTPGIEKTLFL